MTLRAARGRLFEFMSAISSRGTLAAPPLPVKPEQICVDERGGDLLRMVRLAADAPTPEVGVGFKMMMDRGELGLPGNEPEVKRAQQRL